MAQDRTPYAEIGDEVTSVLASARDAGSEIRGQAQRYADTLLDATRNEIDDMRRNANADAAEIIANARADAAELLNEARREVIRIIESAQQRVTDAQAAAGKAIMRRQEMERAQSEVEDKLTELTQAVQASVKRLRDDRLNTDEERGGKDPVSEISSLLARSSAAIERSEY